MTPSRSSTCLFQVLLVVLLVGLLMIGGFGAGWASYNQVFDLIGVAPPARVPEDKRDDVDLTVFWEAVQILYQNYYGDPPQGRDLTYAAIRGVLRALDDPFTSFVDPELARIFEEDMQGEFEGIGATVRMNEEGELVIVAPIEGSPAEAAGLRPGDIVLEVDGRRIKGMTLLEAVSLIRGPKGTPVRLKILRAGQEPFEVEIVRARIEIPTVSARIIQEPGKPKLGYLKLNEFNALATRQVREELQSFRDQGVEGLVFDLRNNPGGLLSTSIEVASQFIEEGQVVLIERGKEGEEIHRARGKGLWLDKPLVVLISEGTASASEIVAGAIQDHQRGVLVGTTTFGKGSVQSPRTLSDGSSLRVTIAHWFTPNGRQIHNQGISPDIVVELAPGDEQVERDPQLERAIEVLIEQITRGGGRE